MNLSSLILTFLVIGISCAISMDMKVANVRNTSYFTNGDPKDCDVAVSNTIIGFYCAEQKYLFFHKIEKFLDGDHSTQEVFEINPAYSHANTHKGSGDYMVTSGFGQNNSFTLTTIKDGKIYVQPWRVSDSRPINFAFDDKLFATINTYIPNGKTYWYVGLLHTNRIYAHYRQIDAPKGLALRVTDSSYNANLYFTYYVSSTSAHQIYKRSIDSEYDYSGSLVYTSIGDNCGTIIEVSSGIVAISCPSSTSSTSSFITVLKESDLSIIHTQTSTSNSFSIATKIQIASFDQYHQVFYNSMKTASGTHGQISLLEVFYSKRNPSEFKTHLTESAISDDTYNSFGKYFSTISSGSVNKFYISSYLSDTSTSGVHEIEVANICSHQQTYSSSTKQCQSVSSGSVSIGLQSTSSITCSAIDDTVSYNRLVGESVCDYGCSSLRFGKNCETCSSYMSRVGETAPSGYTWDDTTANKCKLKSGTTGLEYCSEYSQCSQCVSSGSCEYSNFQCKSTSQSISTDPENIYTQCYDNGVKEHSISHCGPSVINMRNYNSSYNVMPQNAAIPRGVLCRYKLTLDESITDTFTIETDSSSTISFQKVKDGSTTNVSKNTRRNLDENGRNLITTTSTFTVNGADSVNVLYLTNSDLSSPSFSMSSATNYYAGSSTASEPVVESNTTPSGTAEIKNDSSNTASMTGLFIAVGLIGFLIILIIACVCAWKICGKKTHVIVNNNDSNHIEINGDVINVLPREVIQKIEKCRETRYSCKADTYNLSNCVVCLDDFMNGVLVRIVPKCNHMFHSDCLTEVLRSSHRNKLYRCPLCNTKI